MALIYSVHRDWETPIFGESSRNEQRSNRGKVLELRSRWRCFTCQGISPEVVFAANKHLSWRPRPAVFAEQLFLAHLLVWGRYIMRYIMLDASS